MEPRLPAPANWPRISSVLYYEDARSAIEFLVEAFGFETRLIVEHDDGQIAHSELTYGEGLVMVAGPERSERMPYVTTPAAAGGNTQNLQVYVDDVDAHCARARAAGAVILDEPQNVDYGEEYWSDRHYQCRDIGGHYWWFTQRLRSAG